MSSWLQSSFSNPSGACVQASYGELVKASKFIKSKDSSMNGGCLEAALVEFAKSDASHANNGCPEAVLKDKVVFLRDSKDPRIETGDFDHLHYAFPDEWDDGRGVRFVKISIFDVPQNVVDVRISRAGYAASTWYRVNHEGEGVTLYFDQVERDAWESGVQDGQFKFELETV